MPQPIGDNWWRRFFEHPESLELSCFPTRRETELEVLGLEKMLRLRLEDRILDVCCGYGRHLVHLRQRGHDLVGLDASEMMLCGASAALCSAGLRVPLVRGDAARLPFADEAFDVVLNLFNSFGYFLEEGENVRVLAEAARVLKPGGRFFLDTRNRQFQILYAPYHQPVRTEEGNEYILRCTYDRAAKRLDSRWSLPQDPERAIHEASIRLYGLEELRELLDQAGFEELGVYGSYQTEPFEGWQRQLLYVGRKRGD